MSAVPWTTHPKVGGLEILNVPPYSEKDRENQCLIHCLKMVIDYAATGYPDDWVNNNINTHSANEIRKVLTVNRSGWVPDQRELETLSSKVGPIQFNHTLKKQSPTESTFSRILKSHLEDDLPVIPVINVKKLRKDTKAGVHAVVAIGMNDDQISINDPWGYPYDIVPKEEFISAWNDTVNQFVTVGIGGQQRLDSTPGNGGEY